jgi:hypothetical protein
VYGNHQEIQNSPSYYICKIAQKSWGDTSNDHVRCYSEIDFLTDTSRDSDNVLIAGRKMNDYKGEKGVVKVLKRTICHFALLVNDE